MWINRIVNFVSSLLPTRQSKQDKVEEGEECRVLPFAPFPVYSWREQAPLDEEEQQRISAEWQRECQDIGEAGA